MTIPRRRLALVAGALVILGAAGGGLVQAAATPSVQGADPGATARAADDTVLLDSLALISDPTSGGASLPAQRLAVRDRLMERVANVRGHLVHGVVTMVDRDGKLVTYQVDHGTVSAIGSGSITIAEAGGSSVTVSTTTSTRVRREAKRSTLGGLKTGDEVVVRSIVDGGVASARLIIVPPARPAVAAPSSVGNG